MQEKKSGKENKNTEGGGEMRQLREGGCSRVDFVVRQEET